MLGETLGLAAQMPRGLRGGGGSCGRGERVLLWGR